MYKYKSNEELYTSWWLQELKDAGYINEYFYENNSINLSNPVEIEYVKHMKTKSKHLKRNILQGHVYTPDFTIQVTAKGMFLIGNIDHVLNRREHVFYSFKDSGIAYIEVKPMYDQNNMTREFKINQKWLADYGYFVNLFQPEKMFQKTFTPKRYLLTNKSNKPRKIKWKPKTLEEWIGEIK